MPEINYGKIVIEALKKDAFSRRSLPMIGTVILAAIFILMLVLNSFRLPSIVGAAFDSFGILFFALKIPLIRLIFWIITLFFGGVVIKQAGEDAKGEQISLKESFSFVKNKFLSLVAAGIIIVVVPAIINMGVYNDPYFSDSLSLIVSILIALLVFVTYPCIVLGERGAIDAISVSIHHFIENILQVFSIWLLSSVINLVITFIFAIPLIVILPDLAFLLLQFPYLYLPSMSSVTVFAAITVVISAIGIAIALVFSYGVTARYYNEAIGRTEEDGDGGDVE
ncbi:MAG: hypothetical protein U9Q92_07590 [archaeon]|nr:hypothetical protein [archaeon]